ncbi:MAG TPA: hypothetical protein PLG77_13390 [Burkholderiaceae bacterium]|nr:hypothetical protein [Burkholderiaceae bacterium]HRP29418.1 hypothetical protein [Burkholderiaceae bacterium]
MLTLTAANDSSVKHASESLTCGELGIEIPKGHIGPVLLSGTGRSVWWTGRVAIGLRYEPPRYLQAPGHSALRLQDALLRRA